MFSKREEKMGDNELIFKTSRTEASGEKGLDWKWGTGEWKSLRLWGRRGYEEYSRTSLHPYLPTHARTQAQVEAKG